MSIANSIRAQIPPIHKEGYPFIGAFALATLILFWIWAPLGWIGLILTGWCALFFRDPVRVTPIREGVVVSPADGRVSLIQMVLPPAELSAAAVRDAVVRLLDEAAFAKSAAEIRDEMRSMPTPAAIVDRLEGLLA